MPTLNEQVARVVSSKVTGYVADYLVSDEMSELEKAKQKQREAEAKALAKAAARDQGSDPKGSAREDTTPAAIREMMDDEDCPVCTKILDAVADMDEPRRTQGVAEYGEFRRAIEDSEEAAVEVLEDSDVLEDALSGIRAGGL
ncbi:hypothetical protein [uncultured Halorubrum sp.]|uniref:hypothetical protein n=1 Tax=uncultured Halorubrum sp. TaxID=399555 RepID=UPI002619B3EB|nr:hypothetical protein [uncultured Halorubrum sp.]